jgi:hypothetical protein
MLGHYLLESASFDPTKFYSIILAIAVGIFLHVSTTIIFEADEAHRLSWPKSIAIILGLILVLLV